MPLPVNATAHQSLRRLIIAPELPNTAVPISHIRHPSSQSIWISAKWDAREAGGIGRFAASCNKADARIGKLARQAISLPTVPTLLYSHANAV